MPLTYGNKYINCFWHALFTEGQGFGLKTLFKKPSIPETVENDTDKDCKRITAEERKGVEEPPAVWTVKDALTEFHSK